MIRQTRAVLKRITMDCSEVSDDDSSVVISDMKMSRKKKKSLFLKNLDNQVEAAKKKVKREQASYISSITGLYNALIGKIPKAVQDMPVNQFIVNDSQVEERPEEKVTMLSRPSEIIDLQLPLKKLAKGKTPAKHVISTPDDDAASTNDLLGSKEKTLVKPKKNQKSSNSSKSSVKQTPLVRNESIIATPIEHTRPRRMLRSTLKNSTQSKARNSLLSTLKSKKTKKMSIQKSATPSVSSMAPAAKKHGSSVARSTADIRNRKRSSSQNGAPAKFLKVKATPLRQQNQPNVSLSSVGSQRAQMQRAKRQSPDENAAPSFECITLLTGAQPLRSSRPREKVFRLPESACPLTDSQPTIICPLEDGEALTISCDTDFQSLRLPANVVDDLRNIKKKLSAFLKIASLSNP